MPRRVASAAVHGVGFQRALRALPWFWVALAACSSGQRAQRASASDAEIRAALTTYADIAAASYGDAAREARTLSTAIDALLADPSSATLDAARKAWLAARVPYVQTE